MNTVSLLGFIFAIAGAVLIWVQDVQGLGVLVLIAGLICSIIGFTTTKHNGENGHSLALAGIIISAIVIGFFILELIFVSVLFGSFFYGLLGGGSGNFGDYSSYATALMTTFMH
jgi:hypothetical protein